MQLFLSGSGSGEKSAQLDKKFIEAVGVEKPVLYIPIALGTTEHPYSACFEWIKGNFIPFNFSNFIMWTEKELEGKTLKDFEQFSGVYIGGGNTFKLLKVLKELGIFEILKKLVEKNIPIYGGSAGAIILGKTISSAIGYDENEVSLKDLSAMNLLNDYDVWSHYVERQNNEIKEYMSKYNLSKVFAIPEDAGLYVTENEVVEVGKGEIIRIKC